MDEFGRKLRLFREVELDVGSRASPNSLLSQASALYIYRNRPVWEDMELLHKRTAARVLLGKSLRYLSVSLRWGQFHPGCDVIISNSIKRNA